MIPLCAVRFWSAITRDWAIAVAVAVVGLAFTDWYEPYGWLAVIVFVPWFLLFVLQVGRRDDLSRGMTVAGMAHRRRHRDDLLLPVLHRRCLR